MSELAAMRDVIRAEQDADVTIEFRLLALSGTTRPASFAVLGQIPSQLVVHAFFRVDVAVDRFLADA